jgi:hypothetical protein
MTGTMTSVLGELRAALIAAGVTAESPDHLGPEGEQLARRGALDLDPRPAAVQQHRDGP